MLRMNCYNIWHDRDSNSKPTAWERCCPNPTAVIYFWMKRVGNFGLKKKEKRPYWMNNFSCILHMLRKIIKKMGAARFKETVHYSWSAWQGAVRKQKWTAFDKFIKALTKSPFVLLWPSCTATWLCRYWIIGWNWKFALKSNWWPHGRDWTNALCSKCHPLRQLQHNRNGILPRKFSVSQDSPRN